MKGELWKANFEQCRHTTSEEQIAKELLAGELEALREELGATTHKRTFRDMTGLGAPQADDDPLHQAERFDSLGGGPAQRPRRDDGRDVEVPFDSELVRNPVKRSKDAIPFRTGFQTIKLLLRK